MDRWMEMEIWWMELSYFAPSFIHYALTLIHDKQNTVIQTKHRQSSDGINTIQNHTPATACI